VMGWRFRRSVSLGPLRINLSRSGVGYSVGGRGFRVGKDSKGRRYRSLSIPHTGIYRKDYLQSSKGQPNGTSQLPASNPSRPPPLPAKSSLGGSLSAPARWALIGGGAALLYAAIRAIF
jgi:hypothetical protein